jgi:hypothetical protein
MSGQVARRAEVRAAVDVIVEVAGEWEHAYDQWQRAVKVRDRVADRMDRQIRHATAGLSLARWEAVCARSCFHTVDDAKQKARAIRARPAVEAAVAQRNRVLAAEDAKVLAARIALAQRSKTMARYGTVGLDLIGRSGAELDRLARRPAARTA